MGPVQENVKGGTPFCVTTFIAPLGVPKQIALFFTLAKISNACGGCVNCIDAVVKHPNLSITKTL